MALPLGLFLRSFSYGMTGGTTCHVLPQAALGILLHKCNHGNTCFIIFTWDLVHTHGSNKRYNPSTPLGPQSRFGDKLLKNGRVPF